MKSVAPPRAPPPRLIRTRERIAYLEMGRVDDAITELEIVLAARAWALETRVGPRPPGYQGQGAKISR